MSRAVPWRRVSRTFARRASAIAAIAGMSLLLVQPGVLVGRDSMARGNSSDTLQAQSTIQPSSTDNCSAIGEYAGNLAYDLAIGGKQTLDWYVVTYGCSTPQPMQVQGFGVVASPTNTSPPWITIPHHFWVAPKGSHVEVIPVTVHLPYALRDIGVVWPVNVSAGRVLSASVYLTCSGGGGGGGCIVPGVAKLYTISAFDPRIPRVAVSLSTAFSPGVSTAPNISMDPQTVLPNPSTGKFVPYVDVTNQSFANVSSPLMPFNVTYSNPYGRGNGTLNVTFNGGPTSSLSIRNFTGTATVVRKARLVPGTNLISAVFHLSNRFGGSSANETISQSYVDYGFQAVWINATMNASVSPNFIASWYYWVFAPNGTQLSASSVSANTTIPNWVFSGGDLLQFGAKVYLQVNIPGTFTFTVTIGGASFVHPYSIVMSYPT